MSQFTTQATAAAQDQTGSITVNGQVITYTVKGNIIIYSDGKVAAPAITSTDFQKAYATAIVPLVTPPVIPPVDPPVDPDFVSIGTGSGQLILEPLANTNVKVVPGNYDYIYVEKATNVRMDATGVVLKGGSIDIGQADNLELWGASIIDQSYRALSIKSQSNGIYLHDISFKNVGNYTIAYEDKTIYDGTDSTVSKDWKFERLTFENTGLAFSGGGGFQDAGIESLMRNFKFIHCTVKNCPEISDVVYLGAVDGYEIAWNTIDNVNTLYDDPNAPNGYHNGLFHVTGNGSFHDNKITNHQGNAIRAWGASYGTETKDILIYNNIVWNSWKYSAFELQVFPEMFTYMETYPSRMKPANAKVYNNTAGLLNRSHDWEGVMIDLYQTGGTLEFYNNLGFEMYRENPSRPVDDMINMGGPEMIRNENNHYFPSNQQAVADTVNFVSLLPGVGAQ
ncbi:hypothetical protein HDE69_001395 [Pedobacter cryoconitis]|uniref:Right handed beta helix domain-containing protein n=1 Tax=Pedobacter cryoconitis TaxID=188932 RepID=A0A7W9DIR3_9SPHI|nr:hypothetical protein [Pedobacter cryoconitis]MBB5620346.1 hypothetical protein [Pedobacter cryoconitis]MBB5647156.1 hypothetical protein [Pedobacter cryoconitis]